PGIVHGSSGSGASLFLEPLRTVEINNDIVALEQQEREEILRILLALSDAFRRRGAELQRTIAAATALDVLQAKARYGLAIGGIEPRLSDHLELRAARHPLLAGDVVPVDILVIPPTRALVITGPNTGGKTVALKTAGLLPLMAQAGLLVPAAGGTELPIFRSVFADIGDEQSIADNLSTFSAHIANVVSMDKALSLPALVLLDEPGGGTAPNEGGALATAIIDYFRRRDATVVATTHFDALKTYASTTEGVACGAFGFNPETFAPTYRLNYGSPGSSLALEIATRLGLPGPMIDQARAQRSLREAQLADHLAKIERERQEMDHERRLVARERQMVEETQTRLQSREQELRDREETFRKRLDQRIDERLRDARREIDAVVDALKARTSSIAADADRRAARLVPTGEVGSARWDARNTIERIGERLRSDSGAAPSPPHPFPASSEPAAVGDRVAVGPLGMEGVVQSIHDGQAEVDVRGKRMRARVNELRVLVPASAVAASPARVSVRVEMQPRGVAVSELNVIGERSEAALNRVERFLDDASVAELKSVRIIHGYGTGQLRRSIADFLRTQPFVAHFGPAPDHQGGGGVTVVELKD
ncbi:MAG: endonuclease MutS2, partial [Vicinamibacterales bacterium]